MMKINNKVLGKIGIVFLVIIFPYLSFGQLNKFEKPDNLFKCYKSPVIENAIFSQLENDDAILYVGCYFTTDTSGKITSQKFIPFHNIGNDYKSSDSIWQAVINSLAFASKDWVFKPLLWEFKNDKVSERKLNKRAFQRPFAGRPNYLIIFEVSGINGSVMHKISFENHFKISQ